MRECSRIRTGSQRWECWAAFKPLFSGQRRKTKPVAPTAAAFLWPKRRRLRRSKRSGHSPLCSDDHFRQFGAHAHSFALHCGDGFAIGRLKQRIDHGRAPCLSGGTATGLSATAPGTEPLPMIDTKVSAGAAQRWPGKPRRNLIREPLNLAHLRNGARARSFAKWASWKNS